ncbi:SDR family NAD(P)-dependent oxidoreductase [Allosphingosinicella deserti]|uniref:Probable oxidoreductase n=1 Tax=Allosphingosinicella deserti TaxID=2116704 RepID=A0A2P7QZP3_9SPHN|nr:SDR family NAD(P)-dependent oxidoreductase [Sphingomonas deserti]PSJ43431.1 oxidoreductase [Sphingomonas deserti]
MTSRQVPLGSGYGPFTTAEQVIAGIDLTGRTAIVTGGSSGLGLEMVRVLTGAGARAVIPVRDAEKARRTLGGMPNVDVDTIELADPASIDAFAARFLSSGHSLNILIHSAGIMASPLEHTREGHEMQLAVNHLAPFRLTCRLFPALRAAKRARVVSLSSRAHRISPFDFEDPDFAMRPYEPWTAYGQSKTANALFALGLDRRGEVHGVRAFSVHPGSILTDLARHLSRDQVAAFGALDDGGEPRIDPANDLKTVQQGAATAIWCATSRALDGLGGVYCEDCDIAPVRDAADSRKDGVRPWASDPDLSEKLWALSENMTGTRLDA